MSSCVRPVGTWLLLGALSLSPVWAQKPVKSSVKKPKKSVAMPVKNKPVVYQVFTRLFGNTNTTNKPWGTIEENGVGKMNDFTDKALSEIKKMGVTHIWYTGIPHHALIRNYTKYGISNDDPDVVKGRAGSPYAVKDYYQVNPDLAVDPAKRMDEFQALVQRTHQHGMKVIIDIVPNHIARKYEGKNNPAGVRDFGADDNTAVEYDRNNNFYYIPHTPFVVPTDPGYKPLGGEHHPLAEGKFTENPAKWTGNGVRSAQPNINDWYETVKINYGVRPDGSKDFPELPEGFADKGIADHYAFWQGKDVPNSWIKFRDIATFWLGKGVDGFRYDMAEMVPYEFWSYMNSHIKTLNPNAFLLAEVYNPNEYRHYIQLGKMDYLYDKVETYDLLKDVIRGKALPDGLKDIQQRNQDIEAHMLKFLENHDEQRLACFEFADTPEKGLPLMVVTATISTAPVMYYFGQEVGEKADEDGGFGKRSRTSIFDYVGVPAHQRWMNHGAFDGGQLSASEKKLRAYYQRLLQVSSQTEAIAQGAFYDLQAENRLHTPDYKPGLYAYARYTPNDRCVVVANMSWVSEAQISLRLPQDVLAQWQLQEGIYQLTDLLSPDQTYTLTVKEGIGLIPIQLKTSSSVILQLKKPNRKPSVGKK